MITKRDSKPSVTISNRTESPDFCLHIGMPKTGTTTLQKSLFMKHSQVQYLGKYRIDSSDLRPPGTDVFYEFSNVNPYQPKNLEVDALVELVAGAKKQGQVSILSREGLCALPEFHRERISNFVKKTFVAPRVLLTIREPLSFVESLYFQQLKGFQFEKIKYLMKRFGNPPCYFGINEWLDFLLTPTPNQPSSPLLKMLGFGDTAAHYARVIGKENVKVLMFEELKSDSDQFYQELCDFLDIDLEESKQLSKDRIQNFRWTEEPINRIKKYERFSSIRRWYFRQRDQEWREKVLGIQPKEQLPSNYQKAKADISPELKEKILDLTRSQCQIIESEFNIPLRDYGYTVD